MIKYRFKILNGDTNKLIHIAYMEMFQHPERSAWIKHIKEILCCHGFEYIWKDQAVNNEKAFISLFECRIKDDSFRNASVTSEIATDADYTRKLKLCFAVKVI